MGVEACLMEHPVVCHYLSRFNDMLAGDDVCFLLITFANSLDPDQARRFVGPDLDPNCLILLWYS